MSHGVGSPASVGPRKPGTQPPPWAVPIINVCESIFPYCLAAAGVILVLLLSLVFVGRFNYGWMFSLLSVFSFCITVGFLSALIARYDSVIFAWFGVILGIAFMFGGTLAISWLAAQGGMKPTDTAPFVQKMLQSIPNIGGFLIAISMVSLTVGYGIKFMQYRAEHGAKTFKYVDTSRKDKYKPGLIPKCWQMSRCRPGVRETCPNFLEHATCWKRRSGCFCDRELANFLVGAVDRKDAQEVIDMQVSAAKSPKSSELREHMKNAARRPWKQQKLLCHECPLYVEHQEYKYKYWHWVSLPITFVIVAASYAYYHIAYVFAAGFLDELMKKLIAIGGLPDNFTPSVEGLADSPFEYLLLAVLAILLGSYVVGFIDTVILKWKL